MLIEVFDTCVQRATLFTCDLEPNTRLASVSRLMNELRAPQVRIDAEPGQTLHMRNSIGAELEQSLIMRNCNWKDQKLLTRDSEGRCGVVCGQVVKRAKEQVDSVKNQ